jgi:hypothetical protein
MILKSRKPEPVPPDLYVVPPILSIAMEKWTNDNFTQKTTSSMTRSRIIDPTINKNLRGRATQGSFSYVCDPRVGIPLTRLSSPARVLSTPRLEPPQP